MVHKKMAGSKPALSNNGLPCYNFLADNFIIKDQQGKTIAYKKNGDAIVFETKRMLIIQ